MAKLPDGYQGVDERIKKFRADHPEGAIHTEKREVAGDAEVVEIRALVFRNHKEIEMYAASKIATAVGTAQVFGASTKEKTIEKLESTAIGRALATLGYAAVEKEEPQQQEERSVAGDEPEEKREEKKEKSKFGQSRFAKKASVEVDDEDESEDDEDEDDEDSEEEAPKNKGFSRGSRFARKG